MNRRRTKRAVIVAILGAALLAIATAHATSLGQPMNLAGLAANAQVIVTGVVTDITAGQLGGLRYEEIHLQVDRGIRGVADGSSLSFRQLGLHAGQPAEDGRVYVGTLPGTPRYTQGERVLLFLGRTGAEQFRTTVGLDQGRFVFGGTNLENGSHNRGLFLNLGTGDAQLSAKETAMLATTKGAVNADTFVELLERALDDGWWADSRNGGPNGGGSGGGKTNGPRPIGKE